MKSEITKYVPDGDVNGIECKIYDAALIIRPSQDESFYAELPKARNVRAASGDGRLYIKQGKRRFFDKFREQTITLFVPEHVVPEILVYAKTADVSFDGGIYETLDVSANEGRLSLANCSFESVTIGGGTLGVSLSCGTVKDKLVCKTDGGDIVAENSFIACAEYRSGKGNVGLASFNGKDCAFEIDEGNITVTLCGDEDEYSYSLIAREGTCNRESDVKDGAKRKFKAYCAKGNISVDFERTEQTVPTTEEKEETVEEI